MVQKRIYSFKKETNKAVSHRNRAPPCQSHTCLWSYHHRVPSPVPGREETPTHRVPFSTEFSSSPEGLQHAQPRASLGRAKGSSLPVGDVVEIQTKLPWG